MLKANSEEIIARKHAFSLNCKNKFRHNKRHFRIEHENQNKNIYLKNNELVYPPIWKKIRNPSLIDTNVVQSKLSASNLD